MIDGIYLSTTTQSSLNAESVHPKSNLVILSWMRYIAVPSSAAPVTLDSCTCYDFQSRDLPCKHMYRLALELGCLENLPEVDPDAEKDFESRIMTIIDGYYHDLQEGAISADRFLKIASALLTGCSKKFPGSKRKPTQEFKESIPSRVEQFENDLRAEQFQQISLLKLLLPSQIFSNNFSISKD